MKTSTRYLLVLVAFWLGATIRVSAVSSCDDLSCEARVARLVSSNPMPRLGTSTKRLPVFPDEYDLDEQERVLDVWEDLNADASKCFEAIVTHTDDERYCVTFQTSTGVWQNATVGQICRAIVFRNVEFYRRHLRSVGDPKVFPEFIPRGSIKKWWQERDETNLYELQKSGIEWAIQGEIKRGFNSEKEKERVLEPLLRLRQKLRESKKALTVRAWGSDELTFWEARGNK
jgi:hypothetical protein